MYEEKYCDGGAANWVTMVKNHVKVYKYEL